MNRNIFIVVKIVSSNTLTVDSFPQGNKPKTLSKQPHSFLLRFNSVIRGLKRIVLKVSKENRFRFLGAF